MSALSPQFSVTAIRRDIQITYKEPISARKRTEVAARTSTDYFVCGDVVYAPIPIDGSASAARLVNDVKALERLFFEAKELARYLKP